MGALVIILDLEAESVTWETGSETGAQKEDAGEQRAA